MEEAVPMVGKAGTVLYVPLNQQERTELTEYSYFLGTTWHCGGPNMTDKPRRAATIQYCQPYVCALYYLVSNEESETKCDTDSCRREPVPRR